MRTPKTTLHGPKHIIISHVYSSDNKGDAALTSVLIQDLKRVFEDPVITILKLDAVEEDGRFEGVVEKPSFMHYALGKYDNPLVKLAYTSYMVPATLLWAARRGRYLWLPAHLREVAQLYAQADLIVPVGGGYLRSRKGLLNRLNIPLLLHPLLIGYWLGKPTVLYAQSMGPFQNGLERWMMKQVLSRMTQILVREDTSVALLASLGVTGNVERAIDSGFLLKAAEKIDVREAYKIAPDGLLVGVTVRSWLSGLAQTNYESAVAAALDSLVESAGAHVVFIPQVTASKGDDDRVVSRRVRSLMRHREAATLVEGTPDHHQIKALYDGLDLLLGTRFHSVIFSLTSYVPVVAIEYEHKTSGIMRDLGLEDWVIKIEDVTTARLSVLLEKLVNGRAQYSAQLHERLPEYLREAEGTAHVLAESYYTAVPHWPWEV